MTVEALKKNTFAPTRYVQPFQFADAAEQQDRDRDTPQDRKGDSRDKNPNCRTEGNKKDGYYRVCPGDNDGKGKGGDKTEKAERDANRPGRRDNKRRK